MNLGVEEQAQRRKKKDRKRSSRKKANNSAQSPSKHEPIKPNHRKIFKTKILKVEQRKIGLIVGQHGKHIKKLYELTHCDIIVPQHMKKKSDSDFEPDDEDDGDYIDYNNPNFYFSSDMLLENQNASPKKSKQNDKKKKKDTEADDEKEKEDMDSPTRLIDIKLRGTPEEIRDAEVEINFMILKGRLMLDHERNGDSNGGTKQKEEYEEGYDENDDIAEDMRIPSKICGMLIGGGGQKVKELMQETGCEIWVDWDKSSHIEAGVSTVHLKGTKYNVEDAKYKILEIKKLFEKGSNNFRFEVPAFCSKDLFGEHGKNLQRLQKQYNVSINVKNYRNDNRRSLRVGNEEQRIQRTMMIILIGEEYDQQACKKGIDRLVGTFIKCWECKFLTRENDGYADQMSGTWFCQRCWDEFNGVNQDKDDMKGVTQQMDNMQLNGGNYNNNNHYQQQRSFDNNNHNNNGNQPQNGNGSRRVGSHNEYYHGGGGGGNQRYNKNKW